MKSRTINVKGSEIAVYRRNQEDYISLTDMVRNFEDGSSLIEKWLRNKNTIEFVGIWEQLHNPVFNSPEFEGIKPQLPPTPSLVKRGCRRRGRLTGKGSR